MKYWNERRLKRIRERKFRKEKAAGERIARGRIAERRYAKGDGRKNARLVLHALGTPLRRKMVARLAQNGTMSLSKLAEPLDITLPSAMEQLRTLESAGVVSTRKQGRTRLCFIRAGAFEELASLLVSPDVQKHLGGIS